MRSGRRSVREWPAPLCSCSGATTQTSPHSERATVSSRLKPGASMPSSFEMRMRACVRSIGSSNIGADDVQAAHIGSQRLGYGHPAIALLIIFEHRDQSASDRQARAVEGVDEASSLAFLRPKTRLPAATLELAPLRAARDLAIGLLPREPDLDVIGLPPGEPHVAGAQQHDAIGEAEPLQDFFSAGGHALMLLVRAVRVGDRDEFNFLELMLADHPARLLSR